MAKVKREREKHERPLRLWLGSDASFPLHTIGQSKLQDLRHREIHNVCMRRAAMAVAGARMQGGMNDGGHFYHQSTICFFSDSNLHVSLKVQLSSTFSRKLYLTPPLSFGVNSGLTTLTAVLTLCPNPGSSHWPAL